LQLVPSSRGSGPRAPASQAGLSWAPAPARTPGAGRGTDDSGAESFALRAALDGSASPRRGTSGRSSSDGSASRRFSARCAESASRRVQAARDVWGASSPSSWVCAVSCAHRRRHASARSQLRAAGSAPRSFAASSGTACGGARDAPASSSAYAARRPSSPCSRPWWALLSRETSGPRNCFSGGVHAQACLPRSGPDAAAIAHVVPARQGCQRCASFCIACDVRS
jgi:hypothetical protein